MLTITRDKTFLGGLLPAGKALLKRERWANEVVEAINAACPGIDWENMELRLLSQKTAIAGVMEIYPDQKRFLAKIQMSRGSHKAIGSGIEGECAQKVFKVMLQHELAHGILAQMARRRGIEQWRSNPYAVAESFLVGPEKVLAGLMGSDADNLLVSPDGFSWRARSWGPLESGQHMGSKIMKEMFADAFLVRISQALNNGDASLLEQMRIAAAKGQPAGATLLNRSGQMISMLRNDGWKPSGPAADRLVEFASRCMESAIFEVARQIKAGPPKAPGKPAGHFDYATRAGASLAAYPQPPTGSAPPLALGGFRAARQVQGNGSGPTNKP